MSTRTRALVLAASALTTLGTLTACSGSTADTSASTTAATQPAVAPDHIQKTYIAALANGNNPPVTLSVGVDGADVVAYATNGTDDEAWFFGTQQDGALDLTSKWQDTLAGTFDGTEFDGTLMLDGVGYTGTAPSRSAPAGIYTANSGDDRATWIVMSDNDMVGVTMTDAHQTDMAIDKLNATSGIYPGQTETEAESEANRKDRQRRMTMMRRARQIAAAASLTAGSWTTEMNGAAVTATPVSANARGLRPTG